ncbi:MAG TPA: hypothetical protein VNO70_21085 [Blastocatellia bacterium]|nr:hypothetical protein [Blastocatellia bacterium]
MNRRDNALDPDPVIEAYKKDIDRSLIRENLRLSVEQRFEKLMRLQRFAEELRRAGQPRDFDAIAEQEAILEE